LAGDVLAEEAGVTVLGVTDTSHTGPSYRPRGTPLSSASCNTQAPHDAGHTQKGCLLASPLLMARSGSLGRPGMTGSGLSLWTSTVGAHVGAVPAAPG
jgi:hypothetical protein